jgi:hypothetical protein
MDSISDVGRIATSQSQGETLVQHQEVCRSVVSLRVQNQWLGNLNQRAVVDSVAAEAQVSTASIPKKLSVLNPEELATRLPVKPP